MWRADPQTEAHTATNNAGLWALARQEFLVAAGNPKAILIFTAFLPQFVVPGQLVTAQLALLGAMFLALDGSHQRLRLYGFAYAALIC